MKKLTLRWDRWWLASLTLAAMPWFSGCPGHSDGPDGVDSDSDAGADASDDTNALDDADASSDATSDATPDSELDASGDATPDTLTDGTGDAGEDSGPEITDPVGLAIQRLEDESEGPVEVRFNGGVPAFISMSVPIPVELADDAVLQAVDFFERYGDLYGIEDPVEQLFPNRVRFHDAEDTDEPAMDHVVFSQRHLGYPVYAAELAMHMADDRYFVTNGHYLVDIPPLPPADVDAEVASRYAIDAIEGDSLSVTGLPRLMIFNEALIRNEPPIPSETYLAWRINVIGLDDFNSPGYWVVFVDSSSGDVLFVNSEVENHSADKDFDIQTAYNATSITCWDLPTDEWDYWFDEDGEDGYPGTEEDAFQDGLRAWEFAHDVYDFYWQQHDRHSWDDDDEEAEFMVHVPDPDTGAMQWFNAAYASWCGHIQLGDGYATLDIIAHEWGHAIDDNEGDLNYAYQSGALDESFADVSGIRVDDDDYLVGEGRWLGPESGVDANPIRDLSNAGINHISEYTVLPEDDEDFDHGGVHSNSGIPNTVAYLLFAGGERSDFEVESIGRTRAGNLYYYVWVNGVTGDSDFVDARDLMVAYAQYFVEPFSGSPALFGFTDNHVCQVKNAWAAVGVRVSQADRDCDGLADQADPDVDGDGTPDDEDNCPIDANWSQSDIDDDGDGDACDDDIDDDGIANVDDVCPTVEGDDIQTCTDNDHDGVVNAYDNCVNAANHFQEDNDNDGEGDVCDDDDDNDGDDDEDDNCPLLSNSDQADTDSDDVGNVCDNCVEVPNEDQLDCDGDGIGQACDDNEIIFPGGGCSPPYFEEEHVFVHPQDIVTIDACESCGAWLRPDFELSVSVTIENGLPVSILDERGRVVAMGEGGTEQVLTVRPRASFWYQPEGSEGFQGMRYFLSFPGASTAPGYEVDVTVEHNAAE